MYIRFLDGSRKGQVCDAIEHVAHRLISTGMAEDARDAVEAQDIDVEDDEDEAQDNAILPDVITAPPPPPQPKAKARKTKTRTTRSK